MSQKWGKCLNRCYDREFPMAGFVQPLAQQVFSHSGFNGLFTEFSITFRNSKSY